MRLEELNEGNSLVKQIIDAENELIELEEWQKIIEKDDEMVWLSSKEKTGRKTKSICILNGKKVLPLIQECIKEVKERLVEKRTDFEKL
jgi:hypothetical protein